MKAKLATWVRAIGAITALVLALAACGAKEHGETVVNSTAGSLPEASTPEQGPPEQNSPTPGAQRPSSQESSSPPPRTQASPDQLMLRVHTWGGFISPQDMAANVPLSVYRDGRMIANAGATTMEYPAPAIMALMVRQLSSAQLDDLLRKAELAQVGTQQDLGQPSVADVATTLLSRRTDSGLVTTSVYALGHGQEPGSGLSDRQRIMRKKLSDFSRSLEALMHPDSGAGDAGQLQAAPWKPARMAAFARPYEFQGRLMPPGQNTQKPIPSLDWPGPQLPGPALNSAPGLHCTLVSGEALDKIEQLNRSRKANSATAWADAGKRWSITFRPLLPDEHTCADAVIMPRK